MATHIVVWVRCTLSLHMLSPVLVYAHPGHPPPPPPYPYPRLSRRFPSTLNRRFSTPRNCAGLACQGAGRRESAEEYYRLSLELDPLMWVSIRSLCELGAEIDVEKHFDVFVKNPSAPLGGSGKGVGGGGVGHPSSRADGARGGLGGRRLPPWAPHASFNRGGGSGRGGGGELNRCAGYEYRDNGE